MHIRLSLSTLCALAAAVVWSADPAAHASMTGRIEGTVTLVSPGGASVRSGAYPSRRVTRPAPPPSGLANVVVSIENAPAVAGIVAMRGAIVQRDEEIDVTPGATAPARFVLPVYIH